MYSSADMFQMWGGNYDSMYSDKHHNCHMYIGGNHHIHCDAWRVQFGEKRGLDKVKPQIYELYFR